jgi:type I restriction enzyme, S subunit
MNQVLIKFDIDFSIVHSSKIKMDDCRLDPSFFSSNQSLFNDIETKPVEFFCDEIFNPPVFKRDFINDPSECRYLASAEIVSLEPEVTYITEEQSENLRLKVKRGWILVTGFGTIGSIRIVDGIINNYAIANNVARIIPKEKYSGFLAAFLDCSFGNKLLNDHSAGAVVKYIEAPQIAKIPIPVLDESIISKTNSLYLNALVCREKAQARIDRAKILVLQYNNLPPLSEAEIETIDTEKEVEIRTVNISEFTSDYRLDAHFYNPLAKLAEDKIIESCKEIKVLSDVTVDIKMSPLFVRNFVDGNFGIKYIAGKHISQIRKAYKFISKSETINIEEHILKLGWTLMTCAGTLGKIGYVNEELDGATAQDLMRIIPDEDKIDGGYLNSWLSTEYGKSLILRQRYGAVVDRISPEQTGQILIPIINKEKQKEIGDLVRQAYDLRAEAINLEDEAQEILTNTLTGK